MGIGNPIIPRRKVTPFTAQISIYLCLNPPANESKRNTNHPPRIANAENHHGNTFPYQIFHFSPIISVLHHFLAQQTELYGQKSASYLMTSNMAVRRNLFVKLEFQTVSLLLQLKLHLQLHSHILHSYRPSFPSPLSTPPTSQP